MVREERPYGGNRSRPFSSMTSRRLIGSLSREISSFPSIISPAKLGHSPRKKLVLGHSGLALSLVGVLFAC